MSISRKQWFYVCNTMPNVAKTIRELRRENATVRKIVLAAQRLIEEGFPQQAWHALQDARPKPKPKKREECTFHTADGRYLRCVACDFRAKPKRKKR